MDQRLSTSAYYMLRYDVTSRKRDVNKVQRRRMVTKKQALLHCTRFYITYSFLPNRLEFVYLIYLALLMI